jgi:predicted peroxiredoxin
MKKFIIFLFAFVILSSCTEQTEKSTQIPENVSETTDGMFIHLSHGAEDPQRVLMALNMADLMSENKDVLLYFDIKAVHVVLKDAENIILKTDMPGSRDLLARLISKGVNLQVCPGCLAFAGKSINDVMDGIILADKEKFFNFTDGKIISVDY